MADMTPDDARDLAEAGLLEEGMIEGSAVVRELARDVFTFNREMVRLGEDEEVALELTRDFLFGRVGQMTGPGE